VLIVVLSKLLADAPTHNLPVLNFVPVEPQVPASALFENLTALHVLRLSPAILQPETN
jgi:hypothetical protein